MNSRFLMEWENTTLSGATEAEARLALMERECAERVKKLKFYMDVVQDIAAAIVGSVFPILRYSCVPNVSYGFLNHEADLLVMNENRRLYEVEIKISLSDLRADFKKRHGHNDKRISRLFYAIPEPLLSRAKELIPDECGIIEVYAIERPHAFLIHARRVRQAKKLRDYKLNDAEVCKLLRLGNMRYWTRAHGACCVNKENKV